jgi:hypothetical protein
VRGTATETTVRFLRALLNNIRKPKVEIDELFRLVHDEVFAVTDHL